MATIPQLEYVVQQLRAKLPPEYELVSLPIQYGVKLLLIQAEKRAGGSLYFSKKKRCFSFVPHANGDKDISQILMDHINAMIGLRTNEIYSPANSVIRSPLPIDHGYSCWMGTDEAGKGDLFGPLVIAGFICDRTILAELYGLGIRDSKELSRQQIEKCAMILKKKYRGRNFIVTIHPVKYNKLYPNFANRGGINGILGWGHATAINHLSRKKFPLQAVIIDRFSEKDRLRQTLRIASTIKLDLRVRAESDPAVAAAAILARHNYNLARERMQETLGFIPHAGCGVEALNDLQQLFTTAPQSLSHFVKIHFAPVRRLILY